MTYIEALNAAGLEAATGLQALKATDRCCVDGSKVKLIASVDLDTHFSKTDSQSNRWDYGLGFSKDGEEYAIWIEPHSATSCKEITTMIKKHRWVKDKLEADKFKNLKKLTEKTQKKGMRVYWWTTQGKIGFRKGSQDARRLASAGLNFPCRTIPVGSTQI